MTKMIQLQNIDKEEFITIISELLDSKLNKLSKEKLPEYYSVKEIAKLMSVSELTIYNYINKGFIKSSKINRKHLIKREDFETSISEVKSFKYKREI